VRGRADRRGGLGIDEGLEHEAEHLTHHIAAVGVVEQLGDLEQGGLIHGHRVNPFYELIRAFSQSLTR
jgi:hypothetical protein